jgi:dCMP deaminase
MSDPKSAAKSKPEQAAAKKSGSSASSKAPVPPKINPAQSLERIKQVQWDHYYMDVALTVQKRANCLGSEIGAVLVRHNRIVSTGVNGTPEHFPNCRDGGCVRCRERYLADEGLLEEISEPELATGPKQLDLCICVHAEANALLSAARFGNETNASTIYTTHKPCFACLKEAIQAGVERIVYLYDWVPDKRAQLQQQYALLAEHLRKNAGRNFEQLEPQGPLLEHTAGEPRDPNLDHLIALAEEKKNGSTLDLAPIPPKD